MCVADMHANECTGWHVIPCIDNTLFSSIVLFLTLDMTLTTRLLPCLITFFFVCAKSVNIYHTKPWLGLFMGFWFSPASSTISTRYSSSSIVERLIIACTYKKFDLGLIWKKNLIHVSRIWKFGLLFWNIYYYFKSAFDLSLKIKKVNIV